MHIESSGCATEKSKILESVGRASVLTKDRACCSDLAGRDAAPQNELM